MADLKIERWKNRGGIWIWSYEECPRSYQGYHLMADAQGCSFLQGLVKLFQDSKFPAQKTIELNQPRAEHLAVPNCSKKCIPVKTVQFRFRQSFPNTHWSVHENQDKLTIETGTIGLAELERGFADIALGKGDWTVGSGEKALWFWWRS